MKRLLVFLSLFGGLHSMDKPPAKPAAQPSASSQLIELSEDFFRIKEFHELLDRGIEISHSDLDKLFPLAGEKGYTNFWIQHGIEFLMHSRLASSSAVGSSGALSEQARESLFKKYSAEFKDLLRIAKKDTKDKPEGRSLLAGTIDEKAIKAAWNTVLGYGNVRLALDLLKDIRQGYEDAGKPEPAIINFILDELVKKICANLLTITNHLRATGKNDELEQRLKKYFNEEITALRAMKLGDDVKALQGMQRMLLGMLTANANSCPIFVKEKVLEITTPKKGFISSLKGLFAP